MATQHIEITNEWQQVGTGPALLEADKLTYIHIGDVEPAPDSLAYHKIGMGYRYGLSTEVQSPIWARSDLASGYIVITESR